MEAACGFGIVFAIAYVVLNEYAADAAADVPKADEADLKGLVSTVPEDADMLFWQKQMFATGIFNVLLCLWVCRDAAKTTSQAETVSSAIYRTRMRRLGLCLVFGCAFRGSFPRCTVERICFFDSWVNFSLVGRSVAAVSELTYVAELAYGISNVGHELHSLGLKMHPDFETGKIAEKLFACVDYVCIFAFSLICVAECCSFTGVLKQNYGWFTVENSLWATMATLLGLTSYYLAWYTIRVQHIAQRVQPQIDLRFMGRTLTYMAIFATGYCSYQFFIDLPMYYNRWQADKLEGRQDNLLLEGVFDAMSCHKVSRASVDWAPNVLWLTMYFIFCPASAIGLSMAPRILNLHGHAEKDDTSKLKGEQIRASNLLKTSYWEDVAASTLFMSFMGIVLWHVNHTR